MSLKVFPNNSDTVTGIDNVTFVNQPMSFEYDPHKIMSNPAPTPDTSLAAEIRNSQAYKSAEAIFLADKKYGEMYLNRLAMIPSAYKNADRTGFDNINWSNKADDKDLAAYNDAIIKIQNLVGEYYEFINTLPTSQVSQASDAGFNLAQSGQVGSSQMNVQPMSPSVSNQMESTQALEVFGQGVQTIANIASIGTSIAGVYKAFNDVNLARKSLDLTKQLEFAKLGLTESQFVTSILGDLAKGGYSVQNLNIKTVEDLLNWYDKSRNDNKIRAASNMSFVQWFASNFQASPLMAAIQNSDGSINDIGDLIANSFNRVNNSSLTVDNCLKQLSQYKMDTLITQAIFDNLQASYDLEYVEGLDGSDVADADMRTKIKEGVVALHDTTLTQLKEHYVNQFADQFKNATSPADRFALLQVLYDMDLDDQMAAELVGIVGSPTLAKVVQDNYKEVAKGIWSRIDPSRFQDKILKLLQVL